MMPTTPFVLPPDIHRLLAWYDRNRRTLPWRAAPGEVADPYRVLVSEVMLQQTTVAAVIPYFERFVARWPDFPALAEADEADVLQLWAGLGYYSRGKRLHACARIVCAQHGGRLPEEAQALAALPGLGRYTVAAVQAIAFQHPVVPIDGNVERVMARLAAIEAPITGKAGSAQVRRAADALMASARPADAAQALMDLGATVCRPRNPRCPECPWAGACRAAATGRAEDYPVKPPRPPKPARTGRVYVVVRRGDAAAILLRRRPGHGLLAGMLELPGTPWEVVAGADRGRVAVERDRLGADLPFRDLAWRDLAWRTVGTVHHIFTHFRLELEVRSVEVGLEVVPPAGTWWEPVDRLGQAGLPTVFAKALVAAELLASARPQRTR